MDVPAARPEHQQSSDPGRTVTPKVNIIVMSMGDRPTELDRCLRSALAQDYANLEVFLLGNGWPEPIAPDGVRTLGLTENLGISGGRNFAVSQTDGDIFMFLDDDAWIPDATSLSRAVTIFADRPRLALLAPRITAEDGTTLRRWVPRAHVGDPAVSGPAFTCPEGVTIFRRTAWEAVGGFPTDFFYGHEGIEVAWRLRDLGWDAWYQADLVVHHPALPPARHEYYQRMNARNRVWVARRNLPWPLVPVYVGVWTVISLGRNGTDWESTKSWVAGWREGWTSSPGQRHPMGWKTVLRLARLGQPPVI
ncbi:glycosyltransferase [Microlunatus panaciterrae]|uniref:GT2 family glycosyltransferase n=1 Tax=Microlunatus panaciterrae TaxID=400768 RepID=A0ABS2RMK6_9ACTN|nr:glycosyltransferase [Microlunatus panaciterrae]MBM7799426.1 GT2 family glycosyltransferase [Microlunatus panaciterrae]